MRKIGYECCGFFRLARYFANAENAAFFESAIQDVDHLIVPSINLYEVFKRVYQQRGEDVALQAIAQMQQGQVIELTSALALSAAQLSLKERLPMADSVILATARAFQAVLWTQDADFKDLEGVQYIAT